MDKLTETLYGKVLDSLRENKVSSNNDIEEYYDVSPEHLEKFAEHLKNLAKNQRDIQNKLSSGGAPDEKLHSEMRKHFHAINSSGVREALRNHFAPHKK